MTLKLKASALWQYLSRELEDKPQTERKYLWKTYLIEDCCPNYTMNSIKRSEKTLKIIWYFLLFNRQVVSDSLWPHGLQHARPPCPSPSPGVFPSSCPLNRWCHPTILSAVALVSCCLQFFPASGIFPMSLLFASGSQSNGASASASVLPMSIQLISFRTEWSSCCPRGSQEYSLASAWKHQLFSTAFFMAQLSHPYVATRKRLQPWLYKLLLAKWCLCFLIHCLGLL